MKTRRKPRTLRQKIAERKRRERARKRELKDAWKLAGLMAEIRWRLRRIPR